MKNSLEYTVESVFIDLLRSDPRLNGRRFFHHDENVPAKSDAIIVTATEGPKRLDGDQSSDLSVEVEYRSSKATAAQNDVVASAINEAVYGATSLESEALLKCSRFTILSESDGDRGDGTNTRTRTRKFPVFAKLR